MVAHVLQPQRLRMADQLAEHAAPARQVADVGDLLLGQSRGDEALEALAARVEHPERRIARARHLAGGVHDAAEDALELQPLGQHRPDPQQLLKLPLVHRE